MKSTNIVQFIEENKAAIGFGNYIVTVKFPKEVPENVVAKVDLDQYALTIEFCLYKEFLEKTDEEQREVLIHELIHSRLLLMEKNISKIEDEQEELFVNDIARFVRML